MSIQAAMLPDLQIGVETPIPMKREGKQVYAKLIDFGGFPAPYGFRAKSHYVQDIEWKQISWEHSHVSNSTDSRKVSLGLLASTHTNIMDKTPWRFLVDSNSVQVNMLSNTDYRDWDNIVLCLLYTKSNDADKSGSLIQSGPDGTVLTSREGELVWEEGGACDYAIASPLEQGLVPSGGQAGDIYQVSDDGLSYGWRPGVTILDSHLTLYVRKDGNDANNGLENTPAGAKLTINAAINELIKYDAAGNYEVTIVIGNGVYQEAVVLHHRNWGARFSRIALLGESKSETIIEAPSGAAAAVSCRYHSYGAVKNLTLRIPGTRTATQSALSCAYLSYLAVQDVNIIIQAASSGANALTVSTHSMINLAGDNSFSPVLEPEGTVVIFRSNNATIQVTGTCAVSGACSYFALVHTQGVLRCSATFTGKMTWTRFHSSEQSLIDTDGAGINYFPGNVAGRTVSTEFALYK